MTPAGYLEAHCDRFVDELHAFVRIPSISTDPAYAGSIEEAARFVAARMESAGLENAALLPTEGHPLVYADWLHAGDAPTVLVYGHYDVQPADPLADWTSPPFEPEVRDDRLYGRGVSDDKGPMFIPVCVAEAFLRTTERLPVNLKFVIEGEEEMGSAHLAAGVQRYRDRLQADLVLSADGAQWRPDLVTVNVASRGIVSLNLSLTTAAKDLHSGRYGGTVANAAHALGRLVASFHDETGRVAVAGFYDDVRPPTRSEREAMAAIPFDEAAYLAAVGAASPVGEPGYSTLERQWLRPTLDVNGLGCGYQGPGVKTVIPHRARAKISCRLVPDQTPQRIRALLKRHCERHAPSGVRLAFADDGIGMPPASVFARTIRRSLSSRMCWRRCAARARCASVWEGRSPSAASSAPSWESRRCSSRSRRETRISTHPTSSSACRAFVTGSWLGNAASSGSGSRPPRITRRSATSVSSALVSTRS